MTSTFLKRKGREFFKGKRARVLVKQRNLGGDEIEKDTEVTIMHRNQRCDFGLDIKSDTGVEIYNVWCEQLELI